MLNHLLLGLAIGIGLYFARPLAGLLILVATIMAAAVFVGMVAAWNAITFFCENSNTLVH